jgi:hypothetical protein
MAGYQMKGHVEYVTDPDEIIRISRLVMTESRHASFNKMMQSNSGAPAILARFKLEELYSQAPTETSRLPIPLS